MLPCFTVGFNALPRAEHFAAVHTGAAVQGNTVSTVILVLVMWAVTATHTGHTGSLGEATEGKSFSSF